jgi:hypothetical protein
MAHLMQHTAVVFVAKATFAGGAVKCKVQVAHLGDAGIRQEGGGDLESKLWT